jgi:hypothetical protein
MKTLRTLTLVSGLLALAAGLSAQTFEGIIRFKITGLAAASRGAASDSPVISTYSMKGNFTRIDTDMSAAQPGMTSWMIMDMDKREIMTGMPMPGQKMYMVMKIPDPKNTSTTGASGSDIQYTETGQTDTILGYKCEKVLIKSQNGETEAWVAQGLGAFKMMAAGGPMGGRRAPKSSWDSALAAHNAFPLRTVVRDKSGKVQVTLEVIAIEKQSLPDSTFAPPADYQKFDMGGIPGFGGGNPFAPKGD